jgi:hypothetical protein
MATASAAKKSVSLYGIPLPSKMQSRPGQGTESHMTYYGYNFTKNGQLIGCGVKVSNTGYISAGDFDGVQGRRGFAMNIKPDKNATVFKIDAQRNHVPYYQINPAGKLAILNQDGKATEKFWPHERSNLSMVVTAVSKAFMEGRQPDELLHRWYVCYSPFSSSNSARFAELFIVQPNLKTIAQFSVCTAQIFPVVVIEIVKSYFCLNDSTEPTRVASEFSDALNILIPESK